MWSKMLGSNPGQDVKVCREMDSFWCAMYKPFGTEVGEDRYKRDTGSAGRRFQGNGRENVSAGIPQKAKKSAQKARGRDQTWEGMEAGQARQGGQVVPNQIDGRHVQPTSQACG